MDNAIAESTKRQITPIKASLKFSKASRLLSAPDYSAVFDDAPFRASHPNYLILSRPSSKHQPRLGLIIAKKHVKHATQRNRLKRLIRESFRLQQHNLPSIDAIVLARKGADTLSNEETITIINGLWKRVVKRAKKEMAKHEQ